MELRIIGKRDVPQNEFPVVEVAIEGGRLIIDCDNQDTVAEVANLLMNDLFVEGLGFPLRSIDPASGAWRTTGYADLSATPELVLRAIQHGLAERHYEVIA